MELFELEEILKGHLVQFKDWYGLFGIWSQSYSPTKTHLVSHVPHILDNVVFKGMHSFLDANINQFLFTSQVKLSKTVWW